MECFGYRKKMKVNIICSEDVNAWIVGKFAIRLNDELNKMGIASGINQPADTEADISHYIIYSSYTEKRPGINTLMVTHIDGLDRLFRLKKQLETADIGICMSRHTVDNLIKAGIPTEKLCYINPAHDGVIKPRPIVIGITTRIYRDGRKNEHYILNLIKYIEPKEFKFKIMGDGWQNIINAMKEKSFEVEYYENFDHQIYRELIQSIDYYLYLGKDEGQMGFIDALAAGVKTIVTPQGYHLDAVGGITYPVNNFDEVLNAFNTISSQRHQLINSVSDWTWQEYAKKHTEIWASLLSKEQRICAPPKTSLTDKGKVFAKLALQGTLRRYFKRKNHILKKRNRTL
jgi:hypothetical protein